MQSGKHPRASPDDARGDPCEAVGVEAARELVQEHRQREDRNARHLGRVMRCEQPPLPNDTERRPVELRRASLTGELYWVGESKARESPKPRRGLARHNS